MKKTKKEKKKKKREKKRDFFFVVIVVVCCCVDQCSQLHPNVVIIIHFIEHLLDKKEFQS